jgi:hypothetical protein
VEQQLLRRRTLLLQNMFITLRDTIAINTRTANMAIITIVTIMRAANRHTRMARIIRCMSSIPSTIGTIWAAESRLAMSV